MLDGESVPAISESSSVSTLKVDYQAAVDELLPAGGKDVSEY